ncbi:MAG: hypothetical protein WBG50_12740 [Desulfomonilaceae bacterium]
MRLFGRIVVIALLLSALAIPAYCWELTMKGEWEMRYRYWNRTGDRDIFGHMDSQNVDLGINHLKTFPTSSINNPLVPPNNAGASQDGAAVGNLIGSPWQGAPPGAYALGFGIMAGENNWGPEISYIDNRMTLLPEIRVNPAITISANIALTSLGIWSDGEPYKSAQATPGAGFVNSVYVPINECFSAANVPQTYVTVQWLKAFVQTPMVDFAMGYRPSGVGMGLWKNAGQYPSASFEIITYYGPFKFGFIPYLARSQSSWLNNSSVTGTSSRNEGPHAYQRQNIRRDFFRAAEGEIFYANGPLDFWIQSDTYAQSHVPAVVSRSLINGYPGAFGVGTAGAYPTDDDFMRYRITSGFRYFNGRFFWNLEGTALYQWHSGSGLHQTAANGHAFPAGTVLHALNKDVDSWIFGTEFGGICGPAKFTFNFVGATGQDPSVRTAQESYFGDEGFSSIYIKDWGFLMYELYGAGSCWDTAGLGQPSNFKHVGARFDYAVASNLNCWALYSYAWREHPNAFRLGGDYVSGARVFSNDDIFLIKNGLEVGHACPDNAKDIGWEVDGGFDWKLLENFTWSVKACLWQPGSFWSYAYPNTAQLYRIFGSPAANVGASPAAPGGITETAASEANATYHLGRQIDPLFGVQSTLLITF